MLTAFSMRSSASKSISSVVMGWSSCSPLPQGERGECSSGSIAEANEGADGVPGDGTLDVAFALVVEHEDGQPRLAAEADGRQVHHAQIIVDETVIRQLVVAD